MSKITTEDFISRARKIHGDKYDYSLVTYSRSTDKVKIICAQHGVFEQTPHKHLSNRGCPKCGRNRASNAIRRSNEEYIEKVKRVHGDKYDYSLVEHHHWDSKIKIICAEHGVFEQRSGSHLCGNGCPKCGRLAAAEQRRFTMDKFIEKSKQIHGDKYDYSLVDYIDRHEKVKIICAQHGVFEQTPIAHFNSSGCSKCASEKVSDTQRFSKETFIEKAMNKHGNKYDYSETDYKKSRSKLKINCPKHGVFEQVANSHLLGRGCPTCAGLRSKQEMEICDFLTLNNVGYIVSDRTQIRPMELDIYIQELNMGIEYHGLYYHSDKFVGKNYHFEKLKLCENKNIRLVQIFEDEWRDKIEICKSRLLNLIGKTPNKIFARKCKIKDVSPKDARLFLEQNHIQGNVSAKVKLGLYLNDELVSLMTFGNLRKNLGQESKEDAYELLRFCNKLNTNVIGGASKLLKHFEKVYRPKEIISYADRRWSDGNLYKQLGFTFEHISRPNYFYSNNGRTRENRFKYRKSELVKQGFDSNKSEKQIMEEQGFFRIYDCGAIRFVKRI